jgi:uncharacterized membrane protein YgaE (UPF0421/DUF939 family)
MEKLLIGRLHMANWLEKPSSLNWANKKKLAEQIVRLEKNIFTIKETLHSLSSLINEWDSHCKKLLEMSDKKLLTAKHIVEIRPLLQRSEQVNRILSTTLHCEEPTPSLASDAFTLKT